MHHNTPQAYLGHLLLQIWAFASLPVGVLYLLFARQSRASQLLGCLFILPLLVPHWPASKHEIVVKARVESYNRHTVSVVEPKKNRKHNLRIGASTHLAPGSLRKEAMVEVRYLSATSQVIYMHPVD